MNKFVLTFNQTNMNTNIIYVEPVNEKQCEKENPDPQQRGKYEKNQIMRYYYAGINKHVLSVPTLQNQIDEIDVYLEKIHHRINETPRLLSTFEEVNFLYNMLDGLKKNNKR
jgi:hypothetical protein